MTIHSTAIVSSNANLGADINVGPYVVIEGDAEIGDNCEIAAHTVIKRFTKIGARNRIFEHAVLGGEPQDVKFSGEQSHLHIGDDNLIREFCTLHRASGEDQITTVGSRNFFMVGVHIAHNCSIGDDNIFANEVALAGHIVIEDHVFLSNNVGAHQFVRMGRYAMVGGKSKIVQDVLPFFITDGNPPRVRGLNSVGLKRAGFSHESRDALKQAYQFLFRSALPLNEGLEATERLDDPNVAHLVRFIRGSKRGFIRSGRGKGDEEVEVDDTAGNESSVAGV
jgi:UDP-N-acetylglucosamine acyltransferase